MARGTIRPVEGKRGVRWRARVELERGADGKRRWRSETFASKRLAERALPAMQLNAARGGYDRDPDAPVDASPSMALRAYVEGVWLPSYRAGAAPRTGATRERNLRLHVLPALGAVRLDRLTAPQIERTWRALVAGGLSAATVRSVHDSLRVALNRAVAWGLLPANPARHAAPPRRERREYALLTPAGTRAFLAATAGDHKYGPLWHLAAATGLRHGELLALRWGDYDAARGVLAVPARKTAAGRRLMLLHPAARAALAAHGARQAARRLALGPAWRGGPDRAGDPVFDRGDGRPLPARTVGNAWDRARRAHGLPAGCRLHDLRHGYVTALARADVPLALITRLAGHASSAVTLDVYTHLGLAEQEAALGALDALLGGGVSESPRSDTPAGEETG